MNKQQITTLFSCLFLAFTLAAQQPKQNIRGTVIDADTKSGIPFANVSILNSDPLIGTTTDLDGNFVLENIAVGRIDLKVSYIGYENKVIPNILLISGKEKVLTIELNESFHQLDEVVVEGNKKNESNNEMALMSSKKLSIEESKRYAGAISDPARLVSSFAGVANEGSGNNDIIVRGNNPRFIQWRLEGVEIPNPNHFAIEGLTGGPISALNSQMLANSDFYTGAFAPEYGNALSGIFDMKLRKGNNKKREYSASIGILGTDLTTEGPFKKGTNSSYLANYRYSTLSLLDNLGVVDFGGVPKYQDFSFKLNFPSNKAGVFSVFGLGGNSSINSKYYESEREEVLTEEFEQKSTLAITGLNHFMPLNDKTYLKTTLSYAMNGSEYKESRPFNQSFINFHETNLSKETFRLATTAHYKHNSRHKFQLGIIQSNMSFSFENEYFDITTKKYLNGQNNNGNASLSQAFATWNWRVTESLTTVNGVHATKSSLNERIFVEARSALRYALNEHKTLTAGFGMHSKMASLPNHYAIVNENGAYQTPNKNLELLQATHYVLGYEQTLSKNLFLKVEAYYQELYNIPSARNPEINYSLINQHDDIFTDHHLVNNGEGKNIGLEATLERFFANDYYFLITASLYDSKYKTTDGKWRDARFNGNYIANVLAGKEYKVGKTNNKTLGINTKVNLLGGRRYTPINLEKSIDEGHTVFEDNPYSKKADDIFSLNIALNYRINKEKLSHEFKMDVQNVTMQAAAIDYYYNEASREVEEINQLSMLPVLSYTIHF
ncbi:MAG: TonB-dependent receptor [Flavobacteriales bacterium]|nr:TonB-dependent receptor [Flavobacteriales bacterium]|tara:strand:- start:650 stop:2989 length:2340 start_codon:yes stop_codon:yes gene_type:complete